ncbi:putative metal-dependent hydrolase YjjV [Saliniradius amylolyticus]|uniref:Putative metal-dependent hydrolase YjjV n=1 Tax=Saliniradius amylolyticus TaxID=2183582 RepID=A0A2S2E174_9ALTE|nr:TatD family hydrolase [Saliniradius amylolyticus]AWL11405.1 putative metal-dependent hydrolase YjjV [Saliniradius amylolyticus]
MIDSHCHLDFSDFDKDRQSLLDQCQPQGFEAIVVPGVGPKHWSGQLNLCCQHRLLYAALGIHPWFLPAKLESALEQLEAEVKRQRESLVAIGETGLDFSQEILQRFDTSTQQQAFEAQLELAKKQALPVIVHHRKSHHGILQSLKYTGFDGRGVIHAFSGSYEQGKAYIDRGFYLGIGGTVTYPRARKTRDAVARLPLEAMLLETDAPDMPLHGHQGERNSPLFLPQVAKVLAGLKHTGVQEVEAQTDQNSRDLFGIGSDQC